MYKIWNFFLRIVESHPFLWKVANMLVMRLEFLMPHDKSYLAIKHFIFKKKGLFLDVGANNGISILSFRSQCKFYNVISLEPNLLLENSLRKIAKKDKLVEIKMVGVSDKKGSEIFYCPIYKNIVLHTATSGIKSQVYKTMRNFYSKSVLSNIKIKSFVSKIVTIDSMKIYPDIIKIDAEGMDFKVLKGATQTIIKSRPFIIFESEWSNFFQFKKFFYNLNYRLYSYSINEDKFYKIGVLNESFVKKKERNCFAVPIEKNDLIPT